MTPIVSDLRFAARTLLRSPAYTFAGLTTLMLGIGFTTAVFSVVNGVLLSPLPFAEPEQLLRIWERDIAGEDEPFVAWRTFTDWRDGAQSFDAMVAHGPGRQTTVLVNGEPLYLGASGVSEGFLSTLGVTPILGRDFIHEEHQRGADAAVVVSHEFWRSHLGGSPELAGFQLRVRNHSARIIGVLPATFDYPADVGVWYPLELNNQSESRTAHSLQVVGRLDVNASPS
ncbi:MAG: ABC transporter permease, partial [Candidatus Binatia bacterium]